MTTARSRCWGALGALVLTVATFLPAPSPPAASAAPADPHRFGSPVFSADARGDIVTIGNVITTCDPTYRNELWSAATSRAACEGAVTGATGLVRYDGTPMPAINNRLSMRFVDVDDQAATFSSSRARLRIPDGATVMWAGLHWNGATEVPESAELHGSTFTTPAPATGERFSVRLTPPGASAPVLVRADDTWDDTNPGGTVSYAGFADVTEEVRRSGSGTYTVADVQACGGFGGCFASWSMTVAFAHPDETPRNLNVWHGWQLTTPSESGGVQRFGVEGIEPPNRGPVQARIGVVQADGDRGLGPDSLEISSPSHPSWLPFTTIDRPLAAGEDDWFNSTVNAYGRRRPATDAQPNLLANLNQDIALVEDAAVIDNDDRGFAFRVRTGGTESLYSQVVHAAVDLHAPTIAVTKGVEPEGPVTSGDEVTWELRVRNEGIDPIRKAVVADPIPPGLRYVPGSVTYQRGGPPDLLGPKTDAGGDDQVTWAPTSRTLVLRVGAGADAAHGGTLALAPATDGSHEMVITYRTVVELPPDRQVVNVVSATGEGRELEDTFGPLQTVDHDEAVIATQPEADLGITKTDDEAEVRSVGDRYTYRMEVTNAGPSPAAGVSISDDLDPRVRLVGSVDGCTAEVGMVTCAIDDLAVGASAFRSFEVEVVALPGEGLAIPNIAVVHGTHPDPDCDPEHPQALCNADDEETPQPPDAPTTTTEPDRPTTSAPTAAPPPTRQAGPPKLEPTSRSFPRTGWGPWGTVAVGAALVFAGFALLLRRRRAAT
jgi:uncharacterized repeat protein (TIGR01451 family)